MKMHSLASQECVHLGPGLSSVIFTAAKTQDQVRFFASLKRKCLAIEESLSSFFVKINVQGLSTILKQKGN
jgi:hypothetical protein